MLAYLDRFCRFSGDMTLGTLIELGIPLKYLEDRLNGIPLTDFDITVTPVQRNGINAMSIIVGMYDDQKARNIADIRSLIENCPLSEKIKSNSLQIFKRLAASEAHIHSCSTVGCIFMRSGGLRPSLR